MKKEYKLALKSSVFPWVSTISIPRNDTLNQSEKNTLRRATGIWLLILALFSKLAHLPTGFQIGPTCEEKLKPQKNKHL